MRPIDMGAPPRFAKWRRHQLKAIQDICAAFNRGEQVVGVCMPAGNGKTLVAQLVGMRGGGRVAHLTESKGLQDQIAGEFDVADIRGRANYTCIKHPHLNCEQASGACRLVGRGECAASLASEEARSRSFVSNYAWWVTARQRESKTVAGVATLICDEAHRIETTIERLAGVEFWYEGPASRKLADWQTWAAKKEKEVRQEYGEVVGGTSLDDCERAVKLERKLAGLKRLAAMDERTYVYEEDGARKSWLPVYPGRHAGKLIWAGVPRVLLMSATVTKETMRQLGVPDAPLLSYPCDFPEARCPVYWVGCGVRLNYRTGDEEKLKWLEKIDEIIDKRLDRKGIIHTVSYDRQQFVMLHSRHRDRMLGNVASQDQRFGDEVVPVGVSAVVEKFKSSAAPCILVTPSVGMGWDFPGKECEWQVIAKVPYMRQTDLTKKRGIEWLGYQAMQTFAQSTRRGMRYRMDRCETFVVDDSFGWFWMRNKDSLPKWVKVRKMDVVPEPAPRLT
jgi:Rad3-related DNA helicase